MIKCSSSGKAEPSWLGAFQEGCAGSETKMPHIISPFVLSLVTGRVLPSAEENCKVSRLPQNAVEKPSVLLNTCRHNASFFSRAHYHFYCLFWTPAARGVFTRWCTFLIFHFSAQTALNFPRTMRIGN